MRTRVTALALISSIVLAGGVADASTKHKVVKKAPPPVCNLVTDPASDSGPVVALTSQTAGYDPSLDILSADVASDAKNLTVAIRVKQLTAFTQSAPDTASPLGREWQFTLQIGTHSYNLAAFDGPLGTNFTTGATGGTFDYAHNEIRITEPLNQMTFAMPKGTVMSNFQVYAWSALQLDSSAGFGDATPLSKEDAATGKPTAKYLAGTPSCVKVGK